MSRKSSSIEERVRDLLIGFLTSSERKPLSTFINMFFDGNVPASFKKAMHIKIDTETPTNLAARADIVFFTGKTVLCIEVKVNAAEQVGQYRKYQDHFENLGYKTYVMGLINRIKKSRIKNNEPFLHNTRRILWSELLSFMQKEFGKTPAFLEFMINLQNLDPYIGSYHRAKALIPNLEQNVEQLSAKIQIKSYDRRTYPKSLRWLRWYLGRKWIELETLEIEQFFIHRDWGLGF